jgi:hypothetical protein
VIIAATTRLSLWAAWTHMGAERPSTPPLPREGRIDRHEPIALQKTGHEVPCCGRRGAHLAPAWLGRGIRHGSLCSCPNDAQAPPAWGPRCRLNKLNAVRPSVQTVFVGVLGRHERPGGSEAAIVASCACLSSQPDPPRLCETLYTHFSPRQALMRGTAVGLQIMHIFSRHEGWRYLDRQQVDYDWAQR